MPVTTRRRSSLVEGERSAANDENARTEDDSNQDVAKDDDNQNVIMKDVSDQDGNKDGNAERIRIDNRKMSADSIGAELERQVMEALHRSEENADVETHDERDENKSNDEDAKTAGTKIDVSNENAEGETSSEESDIDAPHSQKTPPPTRPPQPRSQAPTAPAAIPMTTTTPAWPAERPLARYEHDRCQFRVRYACGRVKGACDAQFELTDRDAIRCKECGARVIMKLRTKNIVQYEAR